MSRPQNPLNYFRSYSYYFIFGVADSTQTANEVAEQSSSEFNDSLFRHGESKFTARTTTKGGKWALLVNGATDTQLIIKSAKIQSILNPGGGYSGESFYHTMNLQGEIILQEPFGIRLYEILGTISRELCVASTGLVYFLKPIFVGHRDPRTGSAGTDVISNVKPYIFVMLQMTSVVDEGGAVYNMQTFGIVNGASKLQQYQNVASGFNLLIEEKDVSIKNAFKKLTDELNTYFNLKRKSEDEDISRARAGDPNVITQFEEGFLRPIKYEIYLDPQYENPEWKVGTVHDPAYKTTSDKKYYFTQGVTSGIEELIRKIMNSCDKVIDDRGGALDADGKIVGDVSETTPAFIYKIHSAVVSDPEKIIIKYYVHRYRVEFVKIESKTYNEPKAKLEFDYIYTGKNIDIKEFTMKMNSGVIFFHTKTSSNNLHYEDPQTNTSAVTSGWSGSGEALTDGHSCIRRDALIGKREIDNDARNTTTPVSSGTYFNVLKRWSSLENLGVDLVIKGNPNLMDQTTFSTTDIEKFDKEETEASQEGAHRSPLYIKVNVKFPLDYSQPRKGYTHFWYDGPYYVYTIENLFEDGDFVQKLQLYAMKTDVYGDITAKDNPSEEDIAAQKSTSSATSGSASGNPAPSSPTTAPVGPQVENQTTQEEAEAVRKQMVRTFRNVEELRIQAKRVRTKIDIPDIPDIPLEELRTTIDTVRDGIDGLRSEVGKYEDFINKIADEVERVNLIKEKAESIISEKSTIKMVSAIEKEFNILEKLKINPNNILNAITKKAPFLKETWMTFQETYKTVKDQYDKLQESYAELKSIYGELLSFKEELESLKNIIPK